MARPRKEEKDKKVKISSTLDLDVFEKLNEETIKLETERSKLINHILKDYFEGKQI